VKEMMAWCEKHAVDYIFGFARNPRLRRKIAKEMRQAKKEQQLTGEPAHHRRVCFAVLNDESVGPSKNHRFDTVTRRIRIFHQKCGTGWIRSN